MTQKEEWDERGKGQRRDSRGNRSSAKKTGQKNEEGETLLKK